MKSIVLSTIFLLLITITGFSQSAFQGKSIEDGWKEIKACGITFYVPSDLEIEKLRGDDSCIERYRSKNIVLFIDVLGYKLKKSATRKDEYSDEKDFQIVKTKIDGRKAEIITYYKTKNNERWKDLFYGTILFVPQLRNDCCNLTMWANTSSAKDREIVKKIFETVRIDKNVE